MSVQCAPLTYTPSPPSPHPTWSRKQRRIVATFQKKQFPTILKWLVQRSVRFLDEIDRIVQSFVQSMYTENMDASGAKNINILAIWPIVARLDFRHHSDLCLKNACSKLGPGVDQYIQKWAKVHPILYHTLVQLQQAYIEEMTHHLHAKTKAYVQKGICAAKVEETTEIVLANLL